MKSMFSRFLKDKSGATAIEYGIITAMISMALIGGATVVGNAVNSTMSGVAQELQNTQ